MKDIVDRIKTIMEKEGYSAAEFADALSIGRPLLSHVLGGRNNPSLQLLMKVTEHFPSYSIDWLVYGKTPELEVKTENEASKPEVPLVEKAEDISTRKPITQKAVSKTAIKRTLLFYEDGTFEEYKPRE